MLITPILQGIKSQFTHHLMLDSNFKLKIIGDLKNYLGLKLFKSAKATDLCQRKYTIQLLHDTSNTSAMPTSHFTYSHSSEVYTVWEGIRSQLS